MCVFVDRLRLQVFSCELTSQLYFSYGWLFLRRPKMALKYKNLNLYVFWGPPQVTGLLLASLLFKQVSAFSQHDKSWSRTKIVNKKIVKHSRKSYSLELLTANKSEMIKLPLYFSILRVTDLPFSSLKNWRICCHFLLRINLSSSLSKTKQFWREF